MSAIITQVTGPGVPLLLHDIDTDRIIPARFLRCVTFDGIGQYAFEDDRQQDPQHPFNEDKYRSANVLVAGRNFGCGSSREHAPQSLMRWGIAAIIAESFAEIFFGNCISLGVVPVTALRADLEKFEAAIKADHTAQVTVDIESMSANIADQTIKIHMPQSARDALITGQWDFLAQLLENKSAIQKTAQHLAYMHDYQSA